MEYKIITIKAATNFIDTQFDRSAEKLAQEVKDQIALGWEPQGGVCVGDTRLMKQPYLLQAMIRRR